MLSTDGLSVNGKLTQRNGYIFQYIPVCPFTINIESSFLTEIEFTQLNQFNKHKTKDFYVPGARKYAGIQKNLLWQNSCHQISNNLSRYYINAHIIKIKWSKIRDCANRFFILFYVSTISSAKHNDVFKVATQLMFAL